jgi:hypothetical protein
MRIITIKKHCIYFFIFLSLCSGTTASAEEDIKYLTLNDFESIYSRSPSLFEVYQKWRQIYEKKLPYFIHAEQFIISKEPLRYYRSGTPGDISQEPVEYLFTYGSVLYTWERNNGIRIGTDGILIGPPGQAQIFSYLSGFLNNGEYDCAIGLLYGYKTKGKNIDGKYYFDSKKTSEIDGVYTTFSAPNFSGGILFKKDGIQKAYVASPIKGFDIIESLGPFLYFFPPVSQYQPGFDFTDLKIIKRYLELSSSISVRYENKLDFDHAVVALSSKLGKEEHEKEVNCREEDFLEKSDFYIKLSVSSSYYNNPQKDRSHFGWAYSFGFFELPFCFFLLNGEARISSNYYEDIMMLYFPDTIMYNFYAYFYF